MPIQQNVLPGQLLSVNGTIKRLWIKRIEWKNWQGLYGIGDTVIGPEQRCHTEVLFICSFQYRERYIADSRMT